MPDPDLVAAQRYAAVIAHEFTKRPMTLDEAADYAEVIRVVFAPELAADVCDAWVAATPHHRHLVQVFLPRLAVALDALKRENES